MEEISKTLFLYLILLYKLYPKVESCLTNSFLELLKAVIVEVVFSFWHVYKVVH